MRHFNVNVAPCKTTPASPVVAGVTFVSRANCTNRRNCRDRPRIWERQPVTRMHLEALPIYGKINGSDRADSIARDR